METNPSDNPIEELHRILEDVENKGEEVSEQGRDFTRTGQFMADLARATKAALPFLPINANIEYIVEDWRAYNHQADALIVGLGAISVNSVSSTESTAGTVSLSVTGSYANTPSHLLGQIPSSPEAQKAITNLNYVAGRLADVSRVEELLRTLDIDKAPKGRKSPLELFQKAHAAFENPVTQQDPISTSLIPLRECINAVIAELLLRRPTKEETKNEQAKIKSIGRHLKRETISMETIDSLAHQWHEEILQKELSPSKAQSISRDEWSLRLQRATQFLFSLLIGIDPAKMKKRKKI